MYHIDVLDKMENMEMQCNISRFLQWWAETFFMNRKVSMWFLELLLKHLHGFQVYQMKCCLSKVLLKYLTNIHIFLNTQLIQSFFSPRYRSERGAYVSRWDRPQEPSRLPWPRSQHFHLSWSLQCSGPGTLWIAGEGTGIIIITQTLHRLLGIWLGNILWQLLEFIP